MLERGTRRRFREIARRRGRNVNDHPAVRETWATCRRLSLAYLDAVVAVHVTSGQGATPGFGCYARLNPEEQAVVRDADVALWTRLMEDTPWFPGRTLGHPALERLEGEMFAAWDAYVGLAGAHGEAPNCAGFDVERARLFKAGVAAIGFDEEVDEIARLTAPGKDVSGTLVAVELSPAALDVLGPEWPLRNPLPRIELESRLVPDWEFPGYWLLKDNREVSAQRLADLLEGVSTVSVRELRALRGEITLAEFRAGGRRGSS